MVFSTQPLPGGAGMGFEIGPPPIVPPPVSSFHTILEAPARSKEKV